MRRGLSFLRDKLILWKKGCVSGQPSFAVEMKLNSALCVVMIQAKTIKQFRLQEIESNTYGGEKVVEYIIPRTHSSFRGIEDTYPFHSLLFWAECVT